MSSIQPVCLITGASAGIGTALAEVFARHGHTVVLAARRKARLDALAEAIAADGLIRPLVIAVDLASADGTARLADALAERGLEPAYVVNNAGFGLLGEAAALDRERQLSMIDLNVRALTDLSLRFVPAIRKHHGGILNVASITAFVPGPGMAVYHATKSYVLSFTEALRGELAVDGVRVCALCPGPVPTEFFDLAGVPDDYFPKFLVRSASRVANDGYEALMKNQAVVVPGTPNRIFAQLCRLLPRAWALAFMERRWRRFFARQSKRKRVKPRD
jgi:short-subunit dehydrogenase